MTAVVLNIRYAVLDPEEDGPAPGLVILEKRSVGRDAVAGHSIEEEVTRSRSGSKPYLVPQVGVTQWRTEDPSNSDYSVMHHGGRLDETDDHGC